MRIPYIKSLDGIRALAVLLVFFSHSLPFVPGMLGVTTFFFLSGFLITTLLRFEVQTDGRVNLKHFYIRRNFRILPPLYCVLSIAILVQVFQTLPGNLSKVTLACEAFFLTNYRMISKESSLGPGLDVLWSLAVEEHFYLLFPLFYALMAKRLTPRIQALILSSLCVVVFLWRVVLHYALHATILRTRLASDTRIDSILFGCVMAIIANPVMKDDLVSRVRMQMRWLLPLSITTLLVDALTRNIGFRETARYSFDGMALFVCFVFVLSEGETFVTLFLNCSPLRFVGTISYTFYLVHHLLIDLVGTYLPWVLPLRVGVSMALSFVFATGAYYAIERPLARMRSRLLATQHGYALSDPARP